MGEIVDLERYRKLRRRREAEAKKGKRGAAASRTAEDPGTAPAVKQAEPGRTGRKGATKNRGDEPKSD